MSQLKTVEEIKSDFRKAFLKKPKLMAILNKKDMFLTFVQDNVKEVFLFGQIDLTSLALTYVQNQTDTKTNKNYNSQSIHWLSRYLTLYAIRKFRNVQGFRVNSQTGILSWGKARD